MVDLGVKLMALEELRTAKKVIGVKQVMKAVNKGTAKRVFLANDAEERVLKPLYELCKQKQAAVQQDYSMDELGKACMIEVGAAAVAVL